MATTFLKPAPQPGDGAFLMQKSNTKRRRGRRNVKSFLKQRSEADNAVDSGVEKEVESTPQSFLTPPNSIGKEQTSHAAAPVNHGPCTIGVKGSLSRTLQNSKESPERATHANLHEAADKANETQEYSAPSKPKTDNSASIEDTMVTPPHLRKRKAPAALQASEEKSAQDQGQPKGQAQSKTPAVEDPKPKASANTQGKKKDNAHPPPAQEFQWTRSVASRSKSDKDRGGGVKVDEPRPSTPAKSSLVPYPSSREGNEDELPGANNNISKCKDQGSTTVGPTNARSKKANADESKAHDLNGQLRSASAKPNHRGGRQHKNRKDPVCDTQEPPARSTRWPKNSEMRADPKKHDIRWDDGSPNASIDSARADSGWGDVEKKAKAEDDEVRLTGWDGEWAPPPLNWDARPAFRANQSYEKIMAWMEGIERSMFGLKKVIKTEDLTAAEYPEIAPDYWVPIVLGNQSPQTFWNELVKSTEPTGVDEDDLNGVKPWWEFRERQDANILVPRAQPKIEGIDPDETQGERLARENDFGSDKHTENRKRLEKAKRDAERDKRKRAQEKSRRISEKMPNLMVNRESCKPDIKLYLRSAKKDDMARILEIYNYYVQFSVYVPEMERCTIEQMKTRFNAVLQNKLPFIVACERGQVLKARSKYSEGQALMSPDTIVGFAFADDFNDMLSMYRFTVEAEMYVHKDYYMKGVGKCLLDKLMGLLDSEYIERGGYNIQDEKIEGGVGPSRVIKNIIVNLPYDKNNTARLEWTGRWLVDWIGFKRVGDLEEIGVKDGKSVNMAIFQRTTSADINPASPPIMMSRS